MQPINKILKLEKMKNGIRYKKIFKNNDINYNELVIGYKEKWLAILSTIENSKKIIKVYIKKMEK